VKTKRCANSFGGSWFGARSRRFYCDFFADKHAHLPKLGLRAFMAALFARVPSLAAEAKHIDAHFADLNKTFKAYKHAVPVAGAVLLSPDLRQCLMCQDYHSKSWSFPKGKLDRGETDADAAAREVLEEVCVSLGSLPRLFHRSLLRDQTH
jgi:mRNA-decapping enzyme subunit 2